MSGKFWKIVQCHVGQQKREPHRTLAGLLREFSPRAVWYWEVSWFWLSEVHRKSCTFTSEKFSWEWKFVLSLSHRTCYFRIWLGDIALSLRKVRLGALPCLTAASAALVRWTPCSAVISLEAFLCSFLEKIFGEWILNGCDLEAV